MAMGKGLIQVVLFLSAVVESKVTVVELPVIIDNNATETLTIAAGDDWRAALGSLRERHQRLTLEHEDLLARAIFARAHSAGYSLQERCFIIICSGPGSLDKLRATLKSAAEHALQPGFRMALILDGFAMTSNAKKELVNIDIIETAEWEGLPSAFGRAMQWLPPRTIAVIATWGTRFHQDESKDEDLFLAYERLVRGYDREGRLVATATLDEVPVIVLDTATASNLGPPDHGYMFAPGIAAWLRSAACKRTVVLSPPPWPRQFFSHGHISDGNSTLLIANGYPPSHEVDRLQQLDADLYHLLASDNERDFIDYPWYPKRRLTPLSLERKEQDAQRVAAMLCLYDETRFVEALLRDLSPRVDAVLILQATRPWFGESRPLGNAIDYVARLAATDSKISVVRGQWQSEEEQRNAGLALAKLLPLPISHVLLVDGDEFWHPVELDRALALIAKRELTNQKVGYARAAMATYWKSPRIVVHPPEPLRILWLVGIGSLPKELEHCHFSEARNWACTATNSVSTESTHAVMDALGAYLDESTARCHHLSYVRTTPELEAKLGSFAHANDVRGGWLRDVWLRWDEQPNLTNLHPTHPSAFEGTKHQPLWALPPALRRIFLDVVKGNLFGNDADRELYTLRHFEALNANTLLRPDDELIATFLSKKTSTITNHTANCSASSTGSYRDASFTSVTHRHYESSVPVSEIAHRTDIDEPGAPRCHSSGQPRFVILVVGEGVLDTSTEGTFNDTANVLAHSLLELGAAAATVLWCPDLRYCEMRGNALLIVLGVQHLARYWFHSSVSNASMIEQLGWPDPATSILYNFEQAGQAQDLTPDSKLWNLLRRWALVGNLWDYSMSNVLRLVAEPYSLRAQHVPLGYNRWLENVQDSLKDKHRDIDILFVGRIEGSATRRETLRMLREEAGLNLLHANSDSPLFGKRLSDLLLRAKIVLSLRFWSEQDEWKMTRYLPALAHEALVISESNGADVEQRAWQDAIVFVQPGQELVESCRYYLRNHTARKLRAAAGKKILQQRPASLALLEPIKNFVRPLCPNATLSSAQSYNNSQGREPWQWHMRS